MKEEKTLKAFVDHEIYKCWLKMLARLVPNGRTHRLRVVVASMLQFTYDSNNLFMDELFEALTDGPEKSITVISPFLITLFNDAQVAHERKDRHGKTYSVIEQSINEFTNWHEMSWA